MGIRLLTSGGGGVNIEPASSIATDVTLTVPVTGGEIPLKDGSGTITATSFVGDGSGLTGIAGGFSNMQVFTSSGTFTVPSGITKVKVTVVGGGGAGGGATTGNGYGAMGGAGGGLAVKIISGLTPGGTVSVTVGAGGTGGTGAGGTGGTSSFGAYCSATGGTGGTANNSVANGATGGTGSGGDINGRGHCNHDTGYGSPGCGSPLLGGGGSGLVGGGNGNPGLANTGGGGGGAMQNSATARSGGAGGSGVVIVEY